MSEWLSSLGLLVAGQMTAEDARARVTAYVAMLEFPAECFTRATLKAAAEQFRFWPSFAELTAFFGTKLESLREQLAEMERICEHVDRPALPKPPPPVPYVPMTREQADAEWSKFRETVGGVIGQPVPPLKSIDTSPEARQPKPLSPAEIREHFARMFPDIHAEREHRAARAGEGRNQQEDVA